MCQGGPADRLRDSRVGIFDINMQRDRTAAERRCRGITPFFAFVLHYNDRTIDGNLGVQGLIRIGNVPVNDLLYVKGAFIEKLHPAYL